MIQGNAKRLSNPTLAPSQATEPHFARYSDSDSDEESDEDDNDHPQMRRPDAYRVHANTASNGHLTGHLPSPGPNTGGLVMKSVRLFLECLNSYD